MVGKIKDSEMNGSKHFPNLICFVWINCNNILHWELSQ